MADLSVGFFFDPIDALEDNLELSIGDGWSDVWWGTYFGYWGGWLYDGLPRWRQIELVPVGCATREIIVLFGLILFPHRLYQYNYSQFIIIVPILYILHILCYTSYFIHAAINYFWKSHWVVRWWLSRDRSAGRKALRGRWRAAQMVSIGRGRAAERSLSPATLLIWWRWDQLCICSTRRKMNCWGTVIGQTRIARLRSTGCPMSLNGASPNESQCWMCLLWDGASMLSSRIWVW